MSTSAVSTYGKLVTNSTSQKNGFLSGSGFTHTLYNLTGYVKENSTAAGTFEFKNHYSNGSDKIFKLSGEDFIRRPLLGELEVLSTDIGDLTSIYGSTGVLDGYVGSVSKGYFVAPVTGTYKFYIKAVENVTVYASKFKGSAEIDYTKEFLKSTKQRFYYSSATDA